MSPEQRNAMVRGMVARLAERLKQEAPTSRAGCACCALIWCWATRTARAAAGDARRALASDPDKLRRVDELIKGLGLEG